jgi:hypothetical protein
MDPLPSARVADPNARDFLPSREWTRRADPHDPLQNGLVDVLNPKFGAARA